MQRTYIDQFEDMFDDCQLVYMPMQKEEVRGIPLLMEYGKLLLVDKPLPKLEADLK